MKGEGWGGKGRAREGEEEGRPQNSNEEQLR